MLPCAVQAGVALIQLGAYVRVQLAVMPPGSRFELSRGDWGYRPGPRREDAPYRHMHSVQNLLRMSRDVEAAGIGQNARPLADLVTR